MLSFLLLLPFLAKAQDEQPYTMYLSLYLDPKIDQTESFLMNMASHNQKYHQEAPFRASVWSILNGPRSGQFVYVMGPLTWTQMGSREAQADHDADWGANVVAKTENGPEEMEYWRLEEDYTYEPEGGLNSTTARIRIYDIVPGQGGRFREEVLNRVIEVYKAKSYKVSFSLWNNQVRSDNGRDVATVTWYDGWKGLDENNSFRSDFVEVLGQEAWDKFLEALRSSTYGYKDELREVIPDLGSPQE